MQHAQEINPEAQTRDFEYEDISNVSSVVGRLKKCLPFWKNDLKASPYVLHILEFDYLFPFVTQPPKFYAKNNLSSRQHPEFVEKAINDLLSKGCIEELPHRPFSCNPLTVAINNGKKRLVIDLRHVNKFLNVPKFRYEDLNTLAEMFEKGDYFTKFDLTSGYHHIDIHPEHVKFLGFQWEFANGETRFFQFVVLPFGLAPACFVFTKVLRPLVRKWRSAGIRSILYIDDGINGHKTYREALEAGIVVLNDLKKSGFVVNIAKSDFQPKQIGEWLGFVIDTRSMTFTVPERKIKKLEQTISNLLIQKFSSAKQVSRIAGKLSSMHMAIGPLVRLFTRHMYRTIEARVMTRLSFVISNISPDDIFLQ